MTISKFHVSGDIEKIYSTKSVTNYKLKFELSDKSNDSAEEGILLADVEVKVREEVVIDSEGSESDWFLDKIEVYPAVDLDQDNLESFIRTIAEEELEPCTEGDGYQFLVYDPT